MLPNMLTYNSKWNSMNFLYFICRLMFWTNDKNSAIRKAGLDGSVPVSLVSTDIILPRAIAVDETTVFWSDLIKETIESVKYDGTKRKVVLKSIYTLGIAILEQSIYWADPNGLDGCLQVSFLELFNIKPIYCKNVIYKITFKIV